ncbi:hypothetical protein V4C56_41825 [Paraburkholderia azotifigens]|uniref:Uncharacterized protein n=1 Tax=Paraburkholderia azotifigens TaxID=2057004 RepID=A0ABU9RGF7_9BURK
MIPHKARPPLREQAATNHRRCILSASPRLATSCFSRRYRQKMHEKDYKGFPVERKLNRGILLLALPLPALREKVKDCGTTNGQPG